MNSMLTFLNFNKKNTKLYLKHKKRYRFYNAQTAINLHFNILKNILQFYYLRFKLFKLMTK